VDIYKIYAESFRGSDHLNLMLEEAQVIVGQALDTSSPQLTPASETDSKEIP